MVWMETEGCYSAKGKLAPPPPPPTPMKRTSGTMISSITNQEIAMFWKQKRLIKEDHLLAAIKAAARIRARKMTEEDYRYFEESLKRDDDNDEGSGKENRDVLIITERHTGVKDWWTKSKYAYLNQPPIDHDQLIDDNPKRKCRASSYIPNSCKNNGAAPSLFVKTLGIF